MAYNTTPITEGGTIYDIVSTANNATDGVMFNFLTIAIFIILVLIMKRYSFENAFLAASWMCFVLSSLLAFANLVSIQMTIVYGVLSALSALYVWTRG